MSAVVNVVRRLAAWHRYQARHAALAGRHLDMGYRISPPAWQAYREQAAQIRRPS